MIVTIYCLIDPNTLKVRYIGRTRNSLQERLYEHLYRSIKDGERTHKSDWIKSLSRQGKIPIVRRLTTIEGWEESYKLERSLIHKYRDRLVNHNDRGEGGKNTIVSEERKQKISKTLKYKYQNKIIKHPLQFDVHVYNMKGEYLSSYESVIETGKALGIYRSAIDKVLHGECVQARGYRFSKIKYDYLSNMGDFKKGNYKRNKCRPE